MSRTLAAYSVWMQCVLSLIVGRQSSLLEIVGVCGIGLPRSFLSTSSTLRWGSVFRSLGLTRASSECCACCEACWKESVLVGERIYSASLAVPYGGRMEVEALLPLASPRSTRAHACGTACTFTHDQTGYPGHIGSLFLLLLLPPPARGIPRTRAYTRYSTTLLKCPHGCTSAHD